MTVAIDTVLHPLMDKLAPLRVVLWRIGPAGFNVAVFEAGVPLMLIRLRVDGHGFGHEADLRVRPHAVGQIDVKDTVKDCPVVNRFAVGVLVINAGGTPLERGRSITSAKQIVRAEVNVTGPESTEFTNEFLSVFHVGIVRLVRTEHTPDRFHLPKRFTCIDDNVHREGITYRVCRIGGIRCGRPCGHAQDQANDSILHGDVLFDCYDGPQMLNVIN